MYMSNHQCSFETCNSFQMSAESRAPKVSCAGKFYRVGWRHLATDLNMNCKEVKHNLQPHDSARSYKINLPTTDL